MAVVVVEVVVLTRGEVVGTWSRGNRRSWTVRSRKLSD